MSQRAEYDVLVSRLRKMRAEIREDMERDLAQKADEARADGRFFWEDLWVTPEEAEKLHRKLRVRDKVVSAELAILISFLVFASYSVYFVFVHFILPR